LTAHLERAKIQGFSEGGSMGAEGGDPGQGGDGGVNDLEPIVRKQVPEVDAALRYLDGFGRARMTGSGACVFAAFATEQEAQRAIAGVPRRWCAWAVSGLAEHPLASW
jgi:4-diphosphocytidyl-2C-methyl-D-erythritol kinase